VLARDLLQLPEDWEVAMLLAEDRLALGTTVVAVEQPSYG